MNTIKVFAFYLGQEAICENVVPKFLNGRKGKTVGINTVNGDNVLIDFGEETHWMPVEKCKLLLRELRDLNKEELLELVHKNFPDLSNDWNFEKKENIIYINHSENPKYRMEFNLDIHHIISIQPSDYIGGLKIKYVFQWLINKGIAIGINELDEKTPIEVGIAIRKSII